MRNMIDSGVEWLGDIPETWDLVQLGSLFSEHKHKNTGMQSENLLSLSYGNIIRKDINTSDGLLPESFEGYNVIEEGDIVLRLTDLQNDQRSLRVGLSHERGIVTSAYVTLRRRNSAINSRFYYYLIHSYDVRKGFYGMGAGVRQGLNYAGVKKIMLTLPPVDEQENIVSVLDEKTAKVDALIANVQAQIERLKAYKQSLITEVVTKGLDPNAPMKESGVEWIGMIPEHWRLVATKYLFSILSGATPKSEVFENWDGDIAWITPADYKTDDVYVSGGRRNLSELGFQTCSTSLIPKNSIIFSKRAPIGAVAINTNELCTNQGCLSCVNKDDGKIDSKYFYYTMSVATEQYELLGSGTTFKEISASNFANFFLMWPPITEQKAMVEYLDGKCSRIGRLISIKEAKITKLEQYKKSLIYEYVTGKKEVS